MPKPAKLDKAQLIEMDTGLEKEAPGTKPVNVQFNPETLKVTYANQVVTDEKKGAQTGTKALQHVGKGSTKLAVQLWFDINHPSVGDAKPRDVRELTAPVAYFITPKEDPKKKDTFLVPPVKFHWGAFSFVGMMESLEETLELFSNDGRPLRASLTFGLIQQEIMAFNKGQGMRLPATAGASSKNPAGTVPLTSAPAGSSLQGLADVSAGVGLSWQDVASANGIENPRLLASGQLLDLNASVRIEI
jgi:hypothetical protein